MIMKFLYALQSTLSRRRWSNECSRLSVGRHERPFLCAQYAVKEEDNHRGRIANINSIARKCCSRTPVSFEMNKVCSAACPSFLGL
jgi:hypothetical protein